MALKGISPLIAVIMLIAFTMIIAGILATWTTNFAVSKRTQIEFCSEAKGYIQGGTYTSASGGTLNLIINNNGKVDLTFYGILTYKNGSVSRYPGTQNVSAGNIQTFQMTGVSSDLEQATIQSKECTGVQDMLYYYNIRGLS